MPKAMKSVTEVIVMARPACDMVAPIRSATGSAFWASGSVFRHWKGGEEGLERELIFFLFFSFFSFL